MRLLLSRFCIAVSSPKACIQNFSVYTELCFSNKMFTFQTNMPQRRFIAQSYACLLGNKIYCIPCGLLPGKRIWDCSFNLVLRVHLGWGYIVISQQMLLAPVDEFWIVISVFREPKVGGRTPIKSVCSLILLWIMLIMLV